MIIINIHYETSEIYDTFSRRFPLRTTVKINGMTVLSNFYFNCDSGSPKPPLQCLLYCFLFFSFLWRFFFFFFFFILTAFLQNHHHNVLYFFKYFFLSYGGSKPPSCGRPNPFWRCFHTEPPSQYFKMAQVVFFLISARRQSSKPAKRCHFSLFLDFSHFSTIFRNLGHSSFSELIHLVLKFLKTSKVLVVYF